MTKVMVPIIKLDYQDADAYDLALFAVFEVLGYNPEDEFAWTMRVTYLADDERRGTARQKIREALPPDDAERVIALLDEHDWDVSFFVDTY